MAAVVTIPAARTEARAELYWLNLGTGTGFVVWQVDTNNVEEGEDLQIGYIGGPSTTATARTQYVLDVVEVDPTITAMTRSALAIKIRRLAAAAGDAHHRRRRARGPAHKGGLMIPTQMVYDAATDQLVVRVPAAEGEGDVELLRLDVKQLSTDDKRRLRAHRPPEQAQPAPGDKPVTRR